MKILSIKDDWIPIKLPEFIIKLLHLQSGKLERMIIMLKLQMQD
jgi:hypothetical protein